ncbi:hypothetical protein AB0H58_20065 [Nocardia neocaledoniensis]|uniref:hypothetical protein n=1 Tax=Nocardia neocaledoniensis TaxID=236511 RepID=UPI0033C3C789
MFSSEKWTRMMPTQPPFNHYDDPDEFWDEEPIIRPATVATSRPSPSSSAHFKSPHAEPTAPGINTGSLRPAQKTENQAPTSDSTSQRAAYHRHFENDTAADDALVDAWNISGSPYASMQTDRGLLPVSITLDRRWSKLVQPHEYGRELTKAYEQAILHELSRTLSSQRFLADGSLDMDSGTIDRRTQLITLLETSRWSDYQDRLDAILAKTDYQASGHIVHSGEPVVVVVADRVRVNSISVRPDWGVAVDPAALVDDLLSCADQIRRQRPKFTAWGDYTRYSISDLEYHHENHVRTLLEQAYNQ